MELRVLAVGDVVGVSGLKHLESICGVSSGCMALIFAS